MPLIAPAEFHALSADRQASIIAEIKQTVQFAYDHAVPIVVALPPKSPDQNLRSASGFFVEIDGQRYLGTADHVWRWFLARRQQGEDVIFQAGGFAVREDRAGLLRNAKWDVALIPVTEQEVRRSGHHVASLSAGWPPPLPRINSYIVFSGIPERLRERKPDSHVEFGSFSSIMRVTSVSAENIICQFEREHWVSEAVMPPPAPGEDLSGASGGPVFSLDYPLHIPLIGLIYEFNPGLFGSDIELLHVRPMAAAQFT